MKAAPNGASFRGKDSKKEKNGKIKIKWKSAMLFKR